MMSQKNSVEEPLMPWAEDDVDSMSDKNAPARGRRSSSSSKPSLRLLLALIGPWILLTIVITWVLVQYGQRGPRNSIFPQMLYSPAQDAIEYEVRRFRLGFDDDLTEYQGQPSPDLDRRWNALYEMGVSLIPAEMASRLPNKTILFPHDSQRRYVIELDVFHQLHCLNMIRKSLHPDYYKPHNPGPHPGDEDELLGPQHIDHCIDAIRQSLMCSSDISVLTWNWDARKRKNLERATVLHTCRRFDKIQEWAREHAVYEPLDSGYRESDDPLDPETWATHK